MIINIRYKPFRIVLHKFQFLRFFCRSGSILSFSARIANSVFSRKPLSYYWYEQHDKPGYVLNGHLS